VCWLDEERFAKTVPGDLFVGATFGYPDVLAVKLPAGGPTYPLSALVDVTPVPILELRAALFSGDPAGHGGATLPPKETPQVR
jgi:porin